MNIRSKYSQLTLEEIIEWENNNIAIPEPYKAFLLQHNGGDTGDKNTFKVKKMRGEFGFDGFFGIHEGLRGLDYIQTTYTKRNRFPKHYFAIASDVSGNLILMGQNEKKFGKIYFWYHEGEVSENEKPWEKNIYKIAENLDCFLNSLYEEPIEDEDDLLSLFGGENSQKQLDLINSGWDVNEKLDISSQTALERVAQFGNDITVLEALLHKGANIGKAMYHVRNNHENSALQFAKILLEAGANPDYADEKAKENKDTLLKSAVNKPLPKIELAKLLIHYGADITVENDYGWTALKIAQRTLENGVPEMQEVIDLINEKLQK
ncbi:SMI1-KNR4 cell-wall [Chryseobacterium arachidis]|uniref:SMI1-KNR4 cell-wall n=1 Tax=Chryseobacterium arachidis TaxID=1416778 RepID=A0A1M5HUT2_9FLAO|nr:SMI1/KNR4 family protein [Chryseobacterium arachidis]SHG19734.1 SMI1-KNR4 cell-wall [Chryseobacterium arachidis]